MSAPTVATPERVALQLPVAGVGYRSIAYLIDICLLFAVWLVLYFVYSLLGPSAIEVYLDLATWAKTVAIIGVFAAQWLFWTVSEVFWNGQTPGKRLVGIRVVRLDGRAVGPLESAVRNLLRAIDFLPFGYALGLTAMFIDGRHRRLGDLLAGTLLVRDERIDLSKYAVAALPVLPASARGAPLPPEEVELVAGFLSRAPSLVPSARARIAFKMVERYAQGLPAEERLAFTQSVESAEAFLRARLSP
jgi:uncharacterized RDD family membrane protein YckC